MRIHGGLKKALVAGVIAGLMAMPVRAHRRQPIPGENVPGENAAGFTELMQEADHFAAQRLACLRWLRWITSRASSRASSSLKCSSVHADKVASAAALP